MLVAGDSPRAEARAGGDPVKSDGCGTTTTAKSGNGQTIKVGSSNRTYNLKIPDNYDSSHPYRLIVSYHWLNGTANDVSNGSGTAKAWYGLWDLAQGSTIFVAPQGINNGWSNSGGADVEFSRTLITQLESQLCIDKTRIFAEGFSMGGSMSYAMACAMPDTLRAVAVHSGGPMSGCVSHSKPVAYFMTHGTKDSVCTYPGYGVPQLQDFAKMDKCTKPDPSQGQSQFASSMPTPTDNSGKTPACVDFTGCQDGYPVRACLFVGDHTPSPGGTSSSWVPAESWKFISQF
jgi:poly(3-hydroxybutyrate) depolymerase